MNNLPFRLSERAFRRFEEVIKLALESTPQAVGVREMSLAPTTVEARLRDALASFRIHKWAVSWPVDSKALAKLSVWSNQHGVFIGPRIKTKVTPNPLPALQPEPENILLLNTEELYALCLLVSNKKLQGPFLFTIGFPVFFDVIEEKFDVSITDKGSHYLLL